MAASSTVSAGDDVLATQYNNLRIDVFAAHHSDGAGTLLVDADVAAAAAIAYSKLNLATSILNADINAAAAIAYSKLNLTGGILNADINAAAAIAISKLATVTASRIMVSTGGGVISPATETQAQLTALVANLGSYTTDVAQAVTGSVGVQTDVTVTITPGFTVQKFMCIIEFGIAGEGLWSDGGNKSIGRKSLVISGSIDNETLVILSTTQFSNAATAPNTYNNINPYFSSALNASMGFAASTFASPSMSVTEPTGSGTASLFSVTLNGNNIEFNFRSTVGTTTTHEMLYAVRAFSAC